MTQFTRETTGAEVVETLKERVRGKTILITGPSHGGLGAETAISLAAASPALIILAGRSLSKIQPVIDEIKSSRPAVATRFIPLDLGSQASIRESAANINASIEKIDILINNAAIMSCPFSKTLDGIESQFGTNHIGHFLLTNLILDKILAAGEGARIVNVSSSAHEMSDVRFDDWNFEDGKSYVPWAAYGQAKTANILFSLALARRLESKHIYSFSLHPGSIKTNLQVHMSPESRKEAISLVEKNTGNTYVPGALKTLQTGCSTTLVAALDPSIQDRSGAYLSDCTIVQPSEYAQRASSAAKLWALSEMLVGEKF